MTAPDINSTGDHVDIAGYILEALSTEQRAEVDEHLAGCAECRAEVDSLREWSVALEALPEAMIKDGPPEGGDLLLQRTLRQIRTESDGARRRRTTLVSAAAVVVAAAVIGAGVVAGRATAPDQSVAQPPPGTTPSAAVSTVPGTRTASATDATTGARIQVVVTPAPGWVRLHATVSGIPSGEKCRLEIVGKDGKPVLAGSWVVSKLGEANGTNLDGSALIDPAAVQSVRVITFGGKQYTSVTV